MNMNITEKEIKEAVKEITRKPKNKLIKRIQNYFELNPQILEKLTDENLKKSYLLTLYNYYKKLTENDYLQRELTARTTESETTGKLILEVLLKNENNHTDEEMPEILRSDD